MPWREASPMDQRTQFIADHLRDVRSITELCALYGVSRKTGYKWIDRYVRHGPAGLEEASRRAAPLINTKSRGHGQLAVTNSRHSGIQRGAVSVRRASPRSSPTIEQRSHAMATPNT